MDIIRRILRIKRFKVRIGIVLLVCLLLSTCDWRPGPLEQVLQSGVLVAATRNDPTVYYEGPDGPAGFDYELLAGFADYLGVALELVVPDSFSEIIPAVLNGRAQIAAAGLTITPERSQLVKFSFPLLEIDPVVVYQGGSKRPRSIPELYGRDIEVLVGSSHAELLKRLKLEHPDLSWVENSELDVEQLLTSVANGELELTLSDSHVLLSNQRFYPQLRKAFKIGPSEQLAWAFPQTGDHSLYNQAVAYFHELRESGELDTLQARHFGHVERLSYTGAISFASQVRNRLPKYQALFIQAGEMTGWDWRLLAAVGYQESHWNPKARSPTGVRGLMMLTNRTAKELGVKDRRNAAQSISGGARYLAALHKRIPVNVTEPDRTWFTLAAYNIGMGHLYDARRLATKAGLNPDSWLDLRQVLPRLNDKRYHKQTRFGYARGREAVEYVENIRSYYDVMQWLTRDPAANEPLPDDSNSAADAAKPETEKAPKIGVDAL